MVFSHSVPYHDPSGDMLLRLDTISSLILYLGILLTLSLFLDICKLIDSCCHSNSFKGVLKFVTPSFLSLSQLGQKGIVTILFVFLSVRLSMDLVQARPL